jgi:hypothetical protein
MGTRQEIAPKSLLAPLSKRGARRDLGFGVYIIMGGLITHRMTVSQSCLYRTFLFSPAQYFSRSSRLRTLP